MKTSFSSLPTRKAKLSWHVVGGKSQVASPRTPTPPRRPIPTTQHYNADQYVKAIESIRALANGVRRSDADYSKRLDYLNRLDDAIGQLAIKLPRPSIRPVKIDRPAPDISAIEATTVPTPRTASTIALNVVAPHKWTRWITDSTHRPFLYTHKIMPGLYRILATDGIRAIVVPNDMADPPQIIVHCTNLDLYLPAEPPRPPTPRKRATKVVEYSIDDLV